MDSCGFHLIFWKAEAYPQKNHAESSGGNNRLCQPLLWPRWVWDGLQVVVVVTAGQGRGRGQGLTFLDRLERVVNLDKFYGMCDFLALQNVVVETEVWDRQLENLVIPHCVLLEYGTCWKYDMFNIAICVDVRFLRLLRQLHFSFREISFAWHFCLCVA